MRNIYIYISAAISIQYIKNLKIPGWQRKAASHAHVLEDGIRDNHNWQIDAKMINQKASDASLLGCRTVVLCLHLEKKGNMAFKEMNLAEDCDSRIKIMTNTMNEEYAHQGTLTRKLENTPKLRLTNLTKDKYHNFRHR